MEQKQDDGSLSFGALNRTQVISILIARKQPKS